MDTLKFIQNAKEIHGDKYDYSLVIYKNCDTKVKIKCIKCNIFFGQIPYNHIKKKSGCNKCSSDQHTKDTLDLRLNEFIKKAKETHGDKYDYSKVIYINSKIPVIIICNICNNEFKQNRNSHLQGDGGCKECYKIKFKKNRTFTKLEFISKAKEKHGDNYDYSQINYINSQTHINIICKEHGQFKQKPNNHLQGNGCKKCANKLNSKKMTKSTENFIKQSNEMHKYENGLPIYNYSLVEYKKGKDNIIIICNIHGQFTQSPRSHLSGSGCKECGNIKSANTQRYTKELFIQKSKEKHGDKYDYSQVKYINTNTYVTIICNFCNYNFQQVAQSHLQGAGCNKCAHKINHESQKLTESEIIKRAIEIHGNKYDYSNINYKNSYTPIHIKCNKCNNIFKKLHGNHIKKKQGCTFCIEKCTNTATFIEKATKIHNNEFDYKEVIYKKTNIPITIICNKTKTTFYQKPSSHLSGSKCPCCEKSRYSIKAINYLNFIALINNINIKHQKNGGEYAIPNTRYRADGYCKETNTIYEFHGTVFHGDPRKCNPNDSNHFNKNFGELYKNTLKRENKIKNLGYNLIVMWEYDWDNFNKLKKQLYKKFST